MPRWLNLSLLILATAGVVWWNQTHPSEVLVFPFLALLGVPSEPEPMARASEALLAGVTVLSALWWAVQAARARRPVSEE